MISFEPKSIFETFLFKIYCFHSKASYEYFLLVLFPDRFCIIFQNQYSFQIKSVPNNIFVQIENEY